MVSASQKVSLAKIDFDGKNREEIDEKQLKGLAETIKTHGVLNDVILSKGEKAGRFTCVAGERRIRAAKLAGLDAVPAKIVKDLADSELAEIRLVENLQRQDLTLWDEAKQVWEIRDRWNAEREANGMSEVRVEDLVVRLGRPAQWIAGRLAVGKLTLPLRTFVAKQDWPVGHVVLLARVPEEVQAAILEDVKETQESHWCTYNGKRGYRVPTLRELEEFLLAHQRELSRAPWKLDDETLVPAAGSCAACPKRAMAQKLLFPEAGPKKDRCLDAACWNGKALAIVVLSVAKVREGGVEPVFVKTHRGVSAEAVKALGIKEDSVESVYQFYECKKTAPGAKLAICVSDEGLGEEKYLRKYADDRAGSEKKSRPVDQETGKPTPPSKKERLKALACKRQCVAVELWVAAMPKLVPDRDEVFNLIAYFGTSERREHLSSTGGWKEYAKIGEKEILAVAWKQLAEVFEARLKRWGPMEDLADKLWDEATLQATAIGCTEDLDKCFAQAVKDVPMPKVMGKAGIADPDA